MSGPRRIHVGQHLPGIPAAGWNGFVDAYEKLFDLPGPSGRPGPISGANRLTIQVKNTSGGDISASFPVLEIDGPVYNVSDRASVIRDSIVVKGKTPTATATIGDLVIVQGPIGADAIRPGVILGPTWCDVDVTDADHTHATAKSASNTQLASGTTGAKIIWKETGTGTKKALVFKSLTAAGTVNMVLGFAVGAVADTDLVFDIDGLSVVSGTAPAEPLEVANVFEWNIDDNGLVLAIEQPSMSRWIAVQAECPAA